MRRGFEGDCGTLKFYRTEKTITKAGTSSTKFSDMLIFSIQLKGSSLTITINLIVLDYELVYDGFQWLSSVFCPDICIETTVVDDVKDTICTRDQVIHESQNWNVKKS
ncbi:hypothetical protein BLNAU_17115 [Blattamonas nauphoetae]|uniref:Uncharacterized protein n=1 Tax=Blattamonas nauphoetae TaxID=2049346 RepID=A0ABQ9X7R6_9EUKA|nr:hypothetical protein BLNAU_17115 [Blattamonas nauphoetae]